MAQSKLNIASTYGNSDLYIDEYNNSTEAPAVWIGTSWEIETDAGVCQNESSLESPLTVIEIFSKLNQRRFHGPLKRVVHGIGTSEPSLRLIKDDIQTAPYPKLNSHLHPGAYVRGPETVSLMSSSLTEEEVNRINEIYNMTILEDNNISLYNAAKLEVDLGRGSITINMLGDKDYTNTISLKGVEKKYAKPNISGKVDLTVKYTRGGLVYTKDLSFEAFKYDDNELEPKSTSNSYVSPLNNADVVVEYLGGIVRVIPESDDIDECIISSCVVTYGRI